MEKYVQMKSRINTKIRQGETEGRRRVTGKGCKKGEWTIQLMSGWSEEGKQERGRRNEGSGGGGQRSRCKVPGRRDFLSVRQKLQQLQCPQCSNNQHQCFWPCKNLGHKCASVKEGRRNQARSGESQNKFLLSPLEPHTSEIQTTDRALQRNRLISKVQQNRHSKDTDRVGCWPSVKQKERQSNSFTSQWENRGTQTN